MNGAELITVERARQKLAVGDGGEGYTEDHDHGRVDELVRAAIAYATEPYLRQYRDRGDGKRQRAPVDWPWKDQYWKPSPDNRVRELTKAGALIAAAIDAEMEWA